MKELNRKPTCALAACRRTSRCLPIQGQWGSEYDNAMPHRPSEMPAPMRLEAWLRSSGLFTMLWNSSTGNKK